MKDPIFRLCDIIREASYDAHRFLCHGHLEKVYENALVNRLRKNGLALEQQYALHVCDSDGVVLGEFVADLFIENCLIVELKACRSLSPEHTAQLLARNIHEKHVE